MAEHCRERASDDGGDTWSDAALVIDGHGIRPRTDNICGTKPFALSTMDNANARFQIQRLKSGNVLFVKHGLPAKGGKDGRGGDGTS